MFLECKLVFRSYKPLKLEKGMMFLIKHKYEDELIKLTTVPYDEEEFIEFHGYPVEPYIIDPGNPNLNEERILATPEQIGWFDEGEHVDELEDITLGQINRILSGYDGWCMIEGYEDEESEYGWTPSVFMDKITLTFADAYDNDDWDIDADEDTPPDEPDDWHIYNNFNHEGGIKY